MTGCARLTGFLGGRVSTRHGLTEITHRCAVSARTRTVGTGRVPLTQAASGAVNSANPSSTPPRSAELAFVPACGRTAGARTVVPTIPIIVWATIGGVLGLATAACWPGTGTGAASGRNGGADRPPPTLAWDAPLPLLPEDKPPSIRYQQANLRWRTATVAFSQGQFPEAADRFLKVAKVLTTHRPHPHASTFAVARCLAYQNAGRALANVGDRRAAWTKLEEAVADDPACPRTVRHAFEGLGDEP